MECYPSLTLQVSQLVGKTAQQSEALYKQHSLYLNLASQLIQKEAFMGMVRGYQEHSLQVSNPTHLLFLTSKRASASCLPDPLFKPVYTLIPSAWLASMQHQLHPADSAHFGEEVRGYGARSTSAGGAQPHSPRNDSLHSTPRQHIKSREPASVPKVHILSAKD